jgi:N-acetyl-anhydromuramoyl-L-alanine amidase
MTQLSTFRIEPGTGLLVGATYVHSPNQDARPPGATIDLIVVHGISLPPGTFGGAWVEALFTNRLPAEAHPFFKSIEGLRVSAHFYVRRDGHVIQFVPCHARAWHAGASSWGYRLACNDFSVGIELEGADDVPYEAVQYDALARLIEALVATYPTLSGTAVVGHSDVAPGRKTDPGPAFDWERLAAARLLIGHGREKG